PTSSAHKRHGACDNSGLEEEGAEPDQLGKEGVTTFRSWLSLKLLRFRSATHKQKTNDGTADVTRHLACQIGYPNGEQEYRGHEREPEQETINAAWIVPKVLSLPRKRLITRTRGWVQIRTPIGRRRPGVHGDYSNPGQ